MGQDLTLMDTAEVAPRERIPLWSDWIFRLFGCRQSDLYGDTEFDGRMVSVHAGEVILTRLEANRHRVMRSRSHVRNSDEGYLKIVAPFNGCAGVEQENHGQFQIRRSIERLPELALARRSLAE